MFGELVRDGLVDADRLAELLARRRVLDPELEDALRDADGFGGHRGAGARDVARAGQRRAVRALEPAERARRIDRRELLAARRLRVAVHVDDLVDRAEPRRQPVTSADHFVVPAATAARSSGPSAASAKPTVARYGPG